VSDRTRLPSLVLVGVLAGVVVIAVAHAQGTADTRLPGSGSKGSAPSLARPTSPAKAPNADGFLQRWLVLEPIRVSGQLTDSAVQAAVKTEYFPDQLNTIPRDGDTLSVGGAAVAWHAVDTIGYNVNLYHFAYALKKPTSNVLFWVVTVVNAPREMTGVRLAIGSNAASVWWVNGQEVIGIYNERQTVIDDGVSKRLTLQRGPNVVRGAIINAGGHTDFCARFLDDQDRPLKGITVSVTSPSTTGGSVK
jgi:hypothetical protein